MLTRKCEKMYAFRGYFLDRAYHITIMQKPLLPVTVQDQIRLWELEKNRLKSEEGLSYHMHYTRSLAHLDIDLLCQQGIYTPHSLLRPIMNTFSITLSSWTSCFGKTRQSGVSSAVWMDTRTYEGSSRGGPPATLR